MKSKRNPINTLTETQRIVAAATKVIHPPPTVPLELEDIPLFNAIINECPKAEWTTHKIEVAALLARAMADLTREQAMLRIEGGVVSGHHGVPTLNPRKQVVQMQTMAVVQLRRTLSLHAFAAEGKHEAIAKRRDGAKAIEAGVLQSARVDDGLIAHPH
jgi:hypothetical protein